MPESLFESRLTACLSSNLLGYKWKFLLFRGETATGEELAAVLAKRWPKIGLCGDLCLNIVRFGDLWFEGRFIFYWRLVHRKCLIVWIVCSSRNKSDLVTYRCLPTYTYRFPGILCVFSSNVRGNYWRTMHRVIIIALRAGCINANQI